MYDQVSIPRSENQNLNEIIKENAKLRMKIYDLEHSLQNKNN